MKDKIIVDISGLAYNSEVEEAMFFYGLKKIPGVTIIDACTFAYEPKKIKTPIQRINFEGLLRRYGSDPRLIEKIMVHIPEIKPKADKYKNNKDE